MAENGDDAHLSMRAYEPCSMKRIEVVIPYVHCTWASPNFNLRCVSHAGQLQVAVECGYRAQRSNTPAIDNDSEQLPGVLKTKGNQSSVLY